MPADGLGRAFSRQKTRFWPIPTGKRLQSRGAQTRRFRDMTKLQKVRKRVAAKPGGTGDFHQSSPNKGDFIGNRRTVTNRRGHASPSKAAAATPSRRAGKHHPCGPYSPRRASTLRSAAYVKRLKTVLNTNVSKKYTANLAAAELTLPIHKCVMRKTA